MSENLQQFRTICCHFNFSYDNEQAVGEGINAKLADNSVKREDLFITSKLWNTFHDPNEVRGAVEHTLIQMNLKYLDLYLMHSPISYEKSKEFHPKNKAGEILHTSFDLRDTWKAMEKLVDAGLVKSIGVINFNTRQVDYIVDFARIQPVVNQIEVHPYLLNKELIQHCRKKNIVVTAFSPLASPGRPWLTSDDRILLKDPVLQAIAESHSKSPAQILIRYQIQTGNVCIPKSDNREQVYSNIDVFDFSLSDEDIKQLESFDYEDRTCSCLHDINHSEYPF